MRPLLLAMALGLCAPACTELSHSDDQDRPDGSGARDGGASRRDGGDRGSGRSDAASGGSGGSAGPGGAGSTGQAMDGGGSGSGGSGSGAAGGGGRAGDAAADAGDAASDAGTDARSGNSAPEVTIEFPLPGRTDADSITVRGVVRDADGDAITSLTLDGSAVSIDADGAFSAVAALSVGDNALELIAQDALGADSAPAKVIVQRGPIHLWLHPSDVAIDAQRGRALVVDQAYDAVFAVDLASGASRAIADATLDLGPAVTAPSAIEIDYDADCAYVLSQTTTSTLLRIDLDTLDRTTVPLDLGSLYITAIAVDRGKLYAAGGSTFFEIQLPSGQPRVISDDANTALGPALQAATALAIDGSHEVAYLIHQSDGTIKAVTMSSGTRSLFTGGGQGSGTNISGPLAGYYDYGNQRVLVSDEDLHGLISVSTKSATAGVRTTLADATTGTGVPLSTSPGGFALDSVAQRVLVADWKRPQFIIAQRGALTWVDLASGHRTRMSNGIGAGQGLAQPGGLIADPANGRVLVLDYSAGALIALHLGTGNRLVLSDAVAGQGPPLVGPDTMVADLPNHRVFVADNAGKSIVSIDLQSGDRTLISDNAGHGSGTMFEGPRALVYDAPNDRLLVADEGGNDKIMSVNLTGGNRLVLSDNTRTGPSLDQVRALAFAPSSTTTLLAAVGADLIAVDLVSGNRSYVEQHDANAENAKLGFALEDDHWYAFSVTSDAADLVRIEFADGARTVLSGSSKGKGPIGFALPIRWNTALLGKVMLVSQSEVGLVLAIDTVSGDRIVFSM